MCRLSGSVNLPESFVLKANELQKRGGHDHLGIKQFNNVIFGHDLLAIIGNQPQPLENDRYLLTYTGEIYNYKSLVHGASNDSIALLQYLDAHGLHKTLRDINGMFAFALYDKLENKLHLAVDQFSQKPIYYYHEGDKFAFASSPVPLLELKEKWKLSADAVDSYFTLGSTFGENSIWYGIKKVLGSYYITFDLYTNKLTSTRYWSPEFQNNTNDIEDLILESIRQVRIADVPVFTFLSGGIDSTLVASQCPEFHAIHLDSNEKKYAQLAADRFGIKLHVVKSHEENIEQSLIDYTDECGEPSGAAIIPYITARETSKYSKCAIIANGADELFFGYNRTSDTVANQLRHIFRPGYEAHFSNLFGRYYTIDDRLNQQQWYELISFVQFDLNKTLDFASMCHTLEMRSPFLNHKLVEMALSIPRQQHFDQKLGGKAILKRMLRRLGFDDQFLTRPKIGFSFHFQPYNTEELKEQAYKFCVNNGFYKVPEGMNARDWSYLRSACLSFYCWFKAWEHKID